MNIANNWEKTLILLRADIARRRFIQNIPETGWCAQGIYLKKGVIAVILFRLSAFCAQQNNTIVAKILHDFNFLFCKTLIDSEAKVGAGLVLSDAGIIGIPRFATIGRNCTLCSCINLTIGGIEGIDFDNDRIVIGDDCFIGDGAMIMGPIEIADCTQIEANSVVFRSVKEPGKTISGIPGRSVAAKANPIEVSINHKNDKRVAKMPVNRINLAHLFQAINEDIDFRCEYENKQRSLVFLLKLPFNFGFISVLAFRLQQFFDSWGLAPIAWLFKLVNILLFSSSIHSGALIAGGFLIIHPIGIVIENNVRLGPKVVIFALTTITPNSNNELLAGVNNEIIIEEAVQIGTGARIEGNLIVGKAARIGLNAVVKSDVPAGSVAFGVPARILAAKYKAE